MYAFLSAIKIICLKIIDVENRLMVARDLGWWGGAAFVTVRGEWGESYVK